MKAADLLWTKEDYARGVIAWTRYPGLYVRVGVTKPDGSVEWSERLNDPDGTLIPFDAQVLKPQFEIEFTEAMAQRDLWIRIERVVGDVLVARYMHGLGQLEATLQHVPDYGDYHRLVIDASSLDWEHDTVMR